MTRKLAFLILLIFKSFLFQAQDLREVQGNVKLLQKNSLTSGFYAFQPENKSDYRHFSEVKIVKKVSPRLFILKIEPDFLKNELPEGQYFSVGNEWKLSTGLRQKLPQQKALFSLKVSDAAAFLKNSSVEVHSRFGNFFVVNASPEDLQKLLANGSVAHISLYRNPQQEAPVSFHDLAVNTINLVHDNYPEINGDGLKISLKELLFDTTDIDLKNRIFLAGTEAGQADRHATLIATLIAGAGNSSDRSRGVARGAVISSASYLQLFPNEAEFFRSNDIYVQNHSYGTGVEHEYGNEAAAYDQLINELPKLVHVFSSGNAGTATPEAGAYAGIPAFANLTGNFKFAKNVITVGAINKEKEIIERSSKGPAPDGRIKPELVAYAQAGTSDAAALVSGTVLLLQEFYLEKEGSLPDVALVKAILVAAAEDVAAPGIDFSSGYGSLDAAGSMAILEAGNYFTSEVEPGAKEEFHIAIPEGTARLKIALSWNDPAANPGDAVALVNDLNMSLKNAAGKEWLPWVLNSEPEIEKLLAPATRGKDSLNPVELITLESPVGGEYVLKITSENAISEQDFSVAYTVIPEEHFQWTFPTSTNPLVVGGENILRWKTTFSDAVEAKLEVRINGSNWLPLVSDFDLSSGALSWLPKESGKAQLRMIIGTRKFDSEVFAISPALTAEVIYNCEEDVLLSWEKVQGAMGYELQQLGEYYMEDILTLSDTSALLQEDILNSQILAVVPLFEEVKGLQGMAVDYTDQGVACYYSGFFAHLEEDPAVSATLNLSTFLNVEKVIFQKENSGETSVVKEFQAPFDELSLQVRDTEVKPGTNSYSAKIVLEDGTVIETEAIELFVPGMNTFIVYPNPVAAGETLHIISRGDELDFQIYDIRGQKLLEDQLLWFSDRVEFSPATRGLYLIQALRKGEQVGVQKILVK